MDRAILRSLRGEDAAEDIAEAARIRVEGGTTGPQFESYGLWAGAWAAFAGGRPDEVRRLGERAVGVTGLFAPLACPLLVRSALLGRRRRREPPRPWPCWTRRDTSARPWRPTASSPGPGSTPCEGRGPAALAGYREALRAYRKLGLAFDEAAAAVDMAVLLRSPERDAADVGTAIGAARETLDRLGARPFLARLDEARTKLPAG